MVRPEKERDPDRTIKRKCLCCECDFIIPKCRASREFCCSSECKETHRIKKSKELWASRTRSCLKCGNSFFAKKSQLDVGGGNYCSVPCYFAVAGMSALFAPAVRKKAAARYREASAAGLIKRFKGDQSARWKGGKEASKVRNRHKRAASLRAYRKANPEKVREWSTSRAQRKIGRLPRGTVKKIKLLQKNRCAYCKTKVDKIFHVDHIYPLAKGGQHSPSNLQILCPTCSLTKSAKDPIGFLQEKGFLM